MSNQVYAEVPVGPTSVLSLRDGDEVYIPLRNLCEKLGLEWKNEHRRITNDPILGKAVIKMMTAFSNGQEQLLMPLPFLPGWLFKINLNRISDDVRPTLELIQRESYEAIYLYWFKGGATNPRFGTPAATSATDLLKLTDRLKHEWHPEIKAMLHTLLGQMCDRMNLPLPRIEAFGQPAPDDLEIADGFFAGLIDLKRAGVEFDHHRRADLLAVSLPQIERLFATAAIDAPRGAPLRRALRQHPAFIEAAAVNGRDTRIRRCWIFDRSKLPELEAV